MRLPRKRMSPVAQLSLEEVFVAEESPLLRYAFGLLGRRELAEEVVQDAFLKLHEHWDEVEIPRAWLFRCVRNFSFNILRKSKRETLDEKPEERESALERPDDELGRLEAVGMIQMLVSEMEDRDQSMVRMKYFQDLKYQEIADKLEMSVGNVGYRLHHLLKDLGERLRKSGITHF
ncbi:sigma-70 family RNA polymerase sigma factor [Akkermansiaceae bacterium]|nr:sigma-70 family RNA polymerase sigma factor [bacterium]MDB4398787.1 sigma-70 family RNA polymerase sigma factor [Akkermansiaceae bacterium]MDB4448401.1 sigma-70 family RNA polymerase sigma factor [Akkermansiaceae bacterium]MDB4469496.1 sigma-70 family RNA polymerase sigma factor [Akkermansiaceae bacterium]